MTNSIVTSYKQGGAPSVQPRRPGSRREDENRRVVIEWIPTSWHPLAPELLQRMDSLYAFYHQQWWCYRKMLNHFKCCHALYNGLALLLMPLA